MNKIHNAEKTCWNCPAAKLKGNVDFKGCGQSRRIVPKGENEQLKIECNRRPELGHYEPTITFEQCPEWIESEYGYMLKNMRVMILGMDGYLGWTLALKLAKLGFEVSGIDNYTRRDCVMEKGSHSVVPIPKMTRRLEVANEELGVNLYFRRMDINDRRALREFIEEVKPESIVHYAEIPAAPYSMVDADHAIKVQKNNVLGTLGLLHIIRDVVPMTSLVKLGTMGEYGNPETGRPLFEGLFPDDAVLRWGDREWSLGGEIVPKDPHSFYHVSKVQDTYNVYEACKYWWLRSYDIMQGIVYGVHTEEVAAHPDLRTRLDFDEWFGTVINRFVTQAVQGIPLTVYGEGEQIRGMIALDDAMQCMVRLITSPPEPGQYEGVNQISELYKIKEIAKTVSKVANEKFDMDVSIQRLENPRVEAEKHPFNVVSRKLRKEHGYQLKVSMEKEVERMFELLNKDHIKKRIDEKKHIIIPVTRWNGENRESSVVEEYKSEEEKYEGYEGKLYTD